MSKEAGEGEAERTTESLPDSGDSPFKGMELGNGVPGTASQPLSLVIE